MAVEDLSAEANNAVCNQHGALRSTSEAPPAHYIVKIEQFSLLTKNNVERYESMEFEAGGYEWKLVIHPNGNKSKSAGESLSIYLTMAEPTSLPPGREVYAIFRIFLLDQNNDNYLKIEDAAGKGRRFHRMKTEWGFDQFISLKAFTNASNGYLVGDTCVFGAEVFVCKERIRGKTECLSMVKDAVPYKHQWRITSYTKINALCEDSDIFSACNHKWKIQLYPYGKGSIGGYISLYLALAEPEDLSPGTKILAEFTLRILDQLDNRHCYGKASYWFSASKPVWGWKRFISHGNFTQTNRGLVVKDVCRVEAEVTIHGVTNVLV